MGKAGRIFRRAMHGDAVPGRGERASAEGEQRKQQEGSAGCQRHRDFPEQNRRKIGTASRQLYENCLTFPLCLSHFARERGM
jgi:hypothetical protein